MHSAFLCRVLREHIEVKLFGS